MANTVPSLISCQVGQGVQKNDKGEDVCEWCPRRTYSKESIYHGDNASETRYCVTCEPGRFQENSQSSECVACLAGFSATGTGNIECKECPVGNFSASLGSPACTPCGEGLTTRHISSKDNSACVCDVGYFGGGGNMSSCMACPVGSTTIGINSPSNLACLCKAETYMTSDFTACVPCPLGMACPEGNEPPLLKKGFWAAGSDTVSRTYSVYRCRDKKQCLLKPAGSNCALNREGVGCARCMAGTTPKDDIGTCEECAGSTLLPMVFVIIGCSLRLPSFRGSTSRK
jgi:hypothetical protein